VGVVEGLSDPEGLTRIDLNGETFLIAASSLSVANDEESGQRHINDGARRAQNACQRSAFADLKTTVAGLARTAHCLTSSAVTSISVRFIVSHQ